MIELNKIKESKSMRELLEFGIINVDKPSGPTSFQVSDYIRGKLGIKKTAHLGTLDPGVSGVLPICLNRACRLSKYLLRKEKTYVGIMRLHSDWSEKELMKEMKNFKGMIKQMPPVRSSVKREVREREVMKFELLEIEGKDVVFLAKVEAGTYIRTLINDLGKKIGGAHMLELRRIEAGVFDEKEAHNLYELEEAVNEYKKGNENRLREMIIPGEIIGEIFPKIIITEDNLARILNGKPIHKNDVMKMGKLDGEYIAVFCGERFIEVARAVNEGDVVAVPDFIFN